MQGITRNLRYWGYIMEYTFLILLGTLVLISVMTGWNDISNLHMITLEMISDTGFLYIFVLMCMMAISGTTSYLPFTLSMGSTRKDSFIGMQIMMHFLDLQMGVIVLLANAALGRMNQFGDSISSTLIVYGAMMLGSVAVGNIISAIMLRFGRGAGYAAYLGLILVIVLGVVGLIVFKPVEIMRVLFQGPIILLGIALDAISIAVYYKTVKKWEVRV